MRWIHRALALALTSMVWLPMVAPASATAAPICDHIATFGAASGGYQALDPGAEVISLTETSGLVAFVLTDTDWVIVTAAVGFAYLDADGSRIGGQQIVVSPGPQGVLASGEKIEFCLRAVPTVRDRVPAEPATSDSVPPQSRARIVAL